MSRHRTLVRLCLFALFLVAPRLADAKGPEYTRQEDVIYGRKYGVALTMDVITPKVNANGAGVIWVISGGWVSNHDFIAPVFVEDLVARGYTVFAVVHGSQPKFAIDEILQDMNRAVRFIRHRAGDYHVETNRLGVLGASAGGHLSLMLGTDGSPGDPKAKDLVDRESSRVQAVACFFPPTDFLNYGEKGKEALGRGTLAGFRAPFDFREQDPNTHAFMSVTDEKKLREIGRKISPVYHVSADDAPTLIVHGDADRLVPIQQAESIIARFKEVGVPCELVVRKGAGHGWPNFKDDIKLCADWFDKYLKKGL